MTGPRVASSASEPRVRVPMHIVGYDELPMMMVFRRLSPPCSLEGSRDRSLEYDEDRTPNLRLWMRSVPGTLIPAMRRMSRVEGK